MLRRQKHVLSQSTTPFACTLENTVSESTVSDIQLNEFFLPLTEFQGESSMSAFGPFICGSKGTHRVFFLAELTEFAAELTEFSLPKQYSRNSIPPVFPNFRTAKSTHHPHKLDDQRR